MATSIDIALGSGDAEETKATAKTLDQETIYEELAEKIKEYNNKAQLRLIKKALTVAFDAHKIQTRENGEPYITHPIEVARILISLKADSATICAALLHDVVEDTPVKLSQIKEDFGDEIAMLVEGVTKIGAIHFDSKEDYTAENIRKVLLATTKDIRVILIKLADRLHNMRTLKWCSPEKQKRISEETLHIYAPIGHKLGIFRLKGELEDLCLRYLNPEVYKFLSQKISSKRTEREKATAKIIEDVQKSLNEKQVAGKVYGRAKYFYSIYKKMQKKKLDFDQVYDLIALRVVTKSIPDCYAALGVVHDLWKPVPHRFKDYISVPKSNGYQSLHTTVMSSYGKIIEVQIRTEQMQNEAEEGIAAHWRYTGNERDKIFDKRIAWLKQILDWKMQSDDAKDFVETLKVDLFEDEIVVFTPKGDPISLPVKATPVDFAYMVHSNVGDHCTQAKVNGKIVPLDYHLKSGEVIEIITRKNAEPSRQWLKFAVTQKAKSKIRSCLKIEAEDDPKKGMRQEEEVSEATLVKFIRIDGKPAPVKISKCCSPHRSDPIRGFLTKDKKITIHKKECANIYSLDVTKELPVSWTQEETTQQATLMIVVHDRVGLLADVMNLMAAMKVNIISIHTKNKKDNVIIKLKIHVPDEAQVKDLKDAVKKIKAVLDVKVN
ncbi:bifunctional (p)ppGpp synthetase/guanosine-3',5'-bis(diphosphate) 3'-pyrophosphohydrolase [Candidatus Woesearchaeota archaeon]|nr:bifunctional (p)ppGpp synthetase/guanosine-3',5'-bis(diphosphate) 3'-pyrophosphohydrolase [Candidatus Woesearchaeota archaeon]